MRAMDLEMRLTDGTRVPFLNAAVLAVLFYVSTMFPPVFLVSLVSANKRCLAIDMLAGVIVVLAVYVRAGIFRRCFQKRQLRKPKRGPARLTRELR